MYSRDCDNHRLFQCPFLSFIKVYLWQINGNHCLYVNDFECCVLGRFVLLDRVYYVDVNYRRITRFKQNIRLTTYLSTRRFLQCLFISNYLSFCCLLFLQVNKSSFLHCGITRVKKPLKKHSTLTTFLT